jgi:hypothetical protein
MSSRARIFSWFLTLVLVFASSVSLWGQATGTVSGTVKDASGAVVPEAMVTVTQVGTQFKRFVQANSVGQYAAPLLPAGNYEVKVDKQGFTSFLQTGVVLQADSQVQVNAVLAVGGVSTQVTVDTKPSLLQTTSTTLVQVVDSEQIVNLPLNGRDVLDLVALNSGVAQAGVPTLYQGNNLGFGAYEPAISIGGTRSSSVNYMLDNADFNDTQTNLPYPFPNPDAVNQFSVQMSSFDARYGRAAGGVINAVTKSGTNKFHGSAFDFVRNYALNAANYFSGLDSLKQNQFGGTLGGPIWRDKLFFFTSYQGTRRSSANPGALRNVPSAAMENGDFSAWLKPDGTGQIYDPDTGAPFPGNIIPTDRVDPVTVKLLPLIPTSDTYQVRFPTPPTRETDDQFLVRLDQSIGERQRLWGRYYYFHYDNPAVADPKNILYATNGQVGTFSDILGGYSYAFSPRWLNVIDVSYGSENPVLRSTASDPLINLQSLGAQVINVPKVSLLDIGISGWSGISRGNAARNFVKSFQITDNVSYANGRHDLHFGVDIRLYNSGFSSYYRTGGIASFNGQQLSHKGKVNAGNAWAEFYLGVANGFTQTSAAHMDRKQPYYALFIQDNIRLTDKLTANLGLRWNPEPNPSEADNQWTTFAEGQQSTKFPNAPLGIVTYGDPGVGEVIPAKWNLFTPRVGLAYQVTPKTVVRGAYGIFYGEGMGVYLNSMVSSLPWINVESLTGVQYSQPYGADKPIDPLSFTPSSSIDFPAYATYNVPTHDLVPDYTQSWNLIVERQLADNLKFRVGYVGSKGTHLAMSQDHNAAVYGPGATSANRNSRRPFKNIGALNLGASYANSNYNSLQVTLDKRFAHGFNLLANYTFSKSIDNASYSYVGGNDGGPDPLNLRVNRAVSDFDAPHRLVVSGVWELPKLQGQNVIVRELLGGWQNNGIFTIRSGNPDTVVSGIDTNVDGVGGDFADYTYTGWKVSGDRSKQDKINEWFDTSAFSVAAPGTYGTGRRNQIRSSGAWNLDYSLFKNFPIKDLMRLQFRGELFNAFNHANLGDPNVNVNSPNFGTITSASQPRITQLALKLIF